jgi:hypothetical protein
MKQETGLALPLRNIVVHNTAFHVCYKSVLQSLTQEKALDLHNVGKSNENGREKSQRSCQKHESLSLHDVVS